MTKRGQGRGPILVVGSVIALVVTAALVCGALKVIGLPWPPSGHTVVEIDVPRTTLAEPLRVVELTTEVDARPPVLELIEFPNAAVAYPDAWPREHRLDGDLVLVAAEYGELAGRATLSGKCRAGSIPNEVSKVIQEHLAEIGWQIVEMVIEGERQVVIVTEETGGTGNGFYIISADRDGGSLIAVTLVLG